MKKTLAIVLALVMILGVIACTPKSAQQPTTAPQTDTKTETKTEAGNAAATSELAGKYTITVWCADAIVDLTKKQIEDFNNSNDLGIKFNATVEAVGESDSATQMITDVDAGGDLFFFATDQYARLVQAGALGKLGKAAAEFVTNGNDADAVKAIMIGSDMYAYPVTTDNGYFLYYDKSVIPDEDAKSLEKILADCEANKKYFSMETESSAWYLAAFFFGTNCVSEWKVDEDGKFVSITDTFDSPEGLIAAKGMKKLFDSDFYVSKSDAAGFSSDCAAVVTGTWGYNTAKAALGDNLGCAELPFFEVDGAQYHLGSFNGYKMLGVKPQTDAKKGAALNRLAQYLTGAKGQEERFDQAAWGPSNLEVMKMEKVLNHPAVKAIWAQRPYATPQGQIHGSWWDIAKVIGTDIKNATDEAGLQAALDNYKASIAAVFEMSEEDKNAFAVIGHILGTDWNKDFPMTEKEPGVWVAGPFDLKAKEEFKVRQGKSWDVNYGADCAPNGANLKVPADDTYTITLDLNNMTLTFVNKDGVLPEAAPEPEAPAEDTWAAIGAFMDTNWDTDFPMKKGEDGLYRVVLVLKADDAFKVRANGEWGKNYGYDEEGNTKLDGQTNGKVEEDGTYLLTLDANPDAPALTAEKMAVWGVIGSFEASAWNADVAMTEKETGVWVSDPVAFAAGNEFKVRANNEWVVNFGLKDDVIAQDGDNVKVEADGNYVVTLDINAKTLTFAPAA